MIYVFNKNKILSYIIASCIVLMLFTFQTSVIPNKDIELIEVSTNTVNNSINNINNIRNNY